MATEPRIRRRWDGFYDVSGVAGAYPKDIAIRVARTIKAALDAAEADPTQPYFEPNPGPTFTGGRAPFVYSANELEAESADPPHPTQVTLADGSVVAFDDIAAGQSIARTDDAYDDHLDGTAGGGGIPLSVQWWPPQTWTNAADNNNGAKMSLYNGVTAVCPDGESSLTFPSNSGGWRIGGSGGKLRYITFHCIGGGNFGTTGRARIRKTPDSGPAVNLGVVTLPAGGQAVTKDAAELTGADVDGYAFLENDLLEIEIYTTDGSGVTRSMAIGMSFGYVPAAFVPIPS